MIRDAHVTHGRDKTVDLRLAEFRMRECPGTVCVILHSDRHVGLYGMIRSPASGL